MMNVRKIAGYSVIGGLAVTAPAAFAVAPDLTTITAAVDFSTAATAISGVFAALATVYVLMKAGGLVLSRLKR